MKILIVEDEAALASAVRERVREAGHVADWFATLEDARAAMAASVYDFVLLDLGLPDGDGRTFLREIRRTGSPVAVLITTARDQISERIAGLSEGADDYLVKPYDLNELVARIEAVARRYAALPDNSLAVGDVVIDLARRQLSRAGRVVDLSAREWAIVELLARRPGAVCSRDLIEDVLYGLSEDVESNAVEVFISRIRKKAGAGLVTTMRGRGYRLGGAEAS